MASFNLPSAAIELSSSGRDAYLAAHPNPWLLWEHASESSGVLRETLAPEPLAQGPSPGDPVAIEIVKRTTVFALGVTLGHATSCDIVLKRPDVSRLHAYIKVSPSGCALVDMESQNGTFLEGTRLAMGEPAELREGARLTLGTVQLRFFSAAGFVSYLEAAMREPAR